jgi:hypothetical protein
MVAAWKDFRSFRREQVEHALYGGAALWLFAQAPLLTPGFWLLAPFPPPFSSRRWRRSRRSRRSRRFLATFSRSTVYCR